VGILLILIYAKKIDATVNRQWSWSQQLVSLALCTDWNEGETAGQALCPDNKKTPDDTSETHTFNI